jgi:tetratricopeptide (TPR) repeat protein
MSSSEPLGPYVIGERVGTSVWLAEDTRSGKPVAVKLLTKQLPKDAARRETLIRDVRVTAALYHTFLAPILDIVAVGDQLILVMERVQGQSLTKHVAGKPLDRTQLFRLAYQLAEVVKYLHVKAIHHGNISGDSVMVTPAGQLKLGGLNFSNLLRRDNSSTAFQQKGSDLRTVSYLAPEQISTQTADEKTDLFCTGVVVYEMATGRLPYSGATAADVARAIVEGQPASPKAINPALDPATMPVLAGCLFKDPFKRLKDAKALVELLAKTEPSAVEFADQFEKKIAAGTASSGDRRRSILLVADLANYQLMDLGEAQKATARMQQILGESVYLFDGKVVDPFAQRLVAELPTVESALEAARKGEFDFSPGQEGGDLSVRILLHAGELELHEGAAAGAAVEKAFSVLADVPPNTLFVSEEFVKEGRGNVRLRDAGARAGVKLFQIIPPEPPPVFIDSTEFDTGEQEALLTEHDAYAQSEAATPRKRSMIPVALAAMLAVIVVTVLAVMWTRRGPEKVAAPVAAAPSGPPPATASTPRTVLIAAFTLENPDPLLAERANAIRLGAIEVLRTFPELRVTENDAADVTAFSARVRTGATGPELVPTSGAKAGAPAAAPDVATGIAAMVQWITTEVHMQPHAVRADALNPFGDALLARSLNDLTRTDASLRAALAADPQFLPGQLLAMRFFTAQGKKAEALAAAKQVAALDPSNLDATRTVARANLMGGDLREAFAMYNLVLRREPNDAEALNLIAHYAASIEDAPRFNATLLRLKKLPPIHVTAHEPDLLASAGRLDAAVQRYYVVEETASNPSLSLKIGRLAVLRHSLDMANSELRKLEQGDPLYGAPMLRAYIAAEKHDRATAETELKKALTASTPGDDAYTCAAEIYAILNDPRAVIASLEKAVDRKEPTGAYIIASPLFRYLESEPAFQKLRQRLGLQKEEVREALLLIK